jgi:hypothetical protein
MKRTKQRWRAVGVEWRGYVIARVRDNSTGEIVPVYQRRPGGGWLRWDRGDTPVGDSALASTAKRAIADADLRQLDREFREQAAANHERALAKAARRFGRKAAAS